MGPESAFKPAAHPDAGYVHIAQIQSSQQKIIFMDSQQGWTDLYPDKLNATAWMGDDGTGINQARHGTRKNPSFNAAFADGHVGSFLMSELGPRKYKTMSGPESLALHNSYFDPFLKL